MEINEILEQVQTRGGLRSPLVRRRGHASLSQAIEQSEAVCEVLGSALSHDLRAR